MTMKFAEKYFVVFVFFVLTFTPLIGQTLTINGQASSWINSHFDFSSTTQIGIRYLPELATKWDFDNNYKSELDLSLNNYSIGNFAKNRHSEFNGNVKLYRAWFSFASENCEMRVGLQKINFGSATLFRSLMWFDTIDPRDPLQLTDGVYGILFRYYLLNNINIWLWGLYGNDTKGWEILPTKEKTLEYGGRFQTPICTGELGFSFHHREVDLTSINFPSFNEISKPENRYALDGKWDVGIGVWFEASLSHTQTDIPEMKYQRQWTIGADYTFEIGNGLSVLAEYFHFDHPQDIFKSADGFSIFGWSLNYPISLLDRLSTIVYYDREKDNWYRIATWQRTYDNWILYLLAFWNPNNIQIYRTQGDNNPLAGTGIQLMVIFNH